jgi:hypothetical protein
MPPLCTVGFGVSKADWGMAGGAFYLFLINGVFIAFATFVFVKLMKLPVRGEVSDRARWSARLFTTLTVVSVLLPSAYLAWRFVQVQRFVAAATQQVDELARDNRYLLLDRNIDPNNRTVQLTLSGERREEGIGQRIADRLAVQGFAGAQVVVRFSGSERVNVASLKQELRQDVLLQVTREADELRNRVQQLQADNERLRKAQPDQAQLLAELRAQLPQATRIVAAWGTEPPPASGQAAASAPQSAAQVVLLLRIETPRPLAPTERQRLERWLTVREAGRPVYVDYSSR